MMRFTFVIVCMQLVFNFAFAQQDTVDSMHKEPLKTWCEPIVIKNSNQGYIQNLDDVYVSDVIVKKVYKKKPKISYNGFGIQQHQDEIKSHSTGFLISKNGYIITDNSYLEYPKDSIEVIYGNKTYYAELVSIHEEYGLALLKVDGTFEKYFKLSKDTTFNQLDKVFTVGTPLNKQLGQTISYGYISNYRSSDTLNVYQLSMNISQGMTGGPVFDKKGFLYGMIMFQELDEKVEGICFVVPSKYILEKLKLEIVEE